MDKEERSLLEDFPTLSVIISLTAVALLLIIFLIVTLSKTGRFQNNNEQYPVPALVESFLSDITAPSADIEEVLDNYVVETTIAEDSTGEIGGIRDVLSFEYILAVQGDQANGFVLKDSTQGYLEFCILNSKGEETFPRVAFSYVLTEDGSKIADYSIARLQPFSRLDPEYDGRWQS